MRCPHHIQVSIVPHEFAEYGIYFVTSIRKNLWSTANTAGVEINFLQAVFFVMFVYFVDPFPIEDVIGWWIGKREKKHLLCEGEQQDGSPGEKWAKGVREGGVERSGSGRYRGKKLWKIAQYFGVEQTGWSQQNRCGTGITGYGE